MKIENNAIYKQRLLAKIKKVNGCWLWQASGNKSGYGQIRIKGKLILAHRASYDLFVEKIPNGLTLDHLCRNRLCINPDHLEPVTQRLNLLRGVGPTAVNAKKTHCKRGHEFTLENTYFKKSDGIRQCIACQNAQRHEKLVRKNALLGLPLPIAHKLRTHCPAGHEYTTGNTYIDKRDGRRCRLCAKLRQRNTLDKENRSC